MQHIYIPVSDELCAELRAATYERDRMLLSQVSDEEGDGAVFVEWLPPIGCDEGER